MLDLINIYDDDDYYYVYVWIFCGMNFWGMTDLILIMIAAVDFVVKKERELCFILVLMARFREMMEVIGIGGTVNILFILILGELFSLNRFILGILYGLDCYLLWIPFRLYSNMIYYKLSKKHFDQIFV